MGRFFKLQCLDAAGLAKNPGNGDCLLVVRASQVLFHSGLHISTLFLGRCWLQCFSSSLYLSLGCSYRTVIT